jgi:rubrerythrin
MGERELAAAEDASRRRFMELIGGAGAAAAVSIFAAACGGDDGAGGGDAVTSPGELEEETPAGEPGNDLEVVKYLLFIEYFEETFYDQVLESGKVQDGEAKALIEDVYRNEKEHAAALAALVRQLAGTSVPRPKTKFESVINGGEEKILATASVFENLGTAAYLGQADKVQNGRILEATLSIHSVEARHAAALNELAGLGFRAGALEGTIPDGAQGKPVTRDEVLEQTAPYLKV